MNEESHLLREASRQSLITFVDRAMPYALLENAPTNMYGMESASNTPIMQPVASRLFINRFHVAVNILTADHFCNA